MSPARLFHRRSPPPGSPPGTIAQAPEAPPLRVRAIRFDAQRIEEVEGVGEALALTAAPGEGTLWLDVVGVGDEEGLQRLGERLGLHPLAVADIANVGQRPKFEALENGAALLILRMLRFEEGLRVQWEQVSVVWRKGMVATFQEREGDCFEPVRRRLRAGRPRIRSGGADFLAVQLVDAVVDHVFPMLEALGDGLEDLEEIVLQGPGGGDALVRLHGLKRDLLLLRRALWPLRDALSTALRSETETVRRQTLPYLRDVADHVAQAAEVAESLRELAASLMDAHLSQVGNRTNEVMRTLTIVATIFIPLTFLAGVYGMNFDRSSPYNMPELGWRFGYAAFWGASLALAAGLLALFRRLGWLGGGGRD